ncbi:hypothetical protein AG1IA_09496 [Rhizoctonia solani AG-1 IA]|uniref:Uncharacterized protein n=1 Tax=Thanatephorus cucumeris (strain AG1-IA) TaxID=983506 RepID=L8WJC5_THACA|nr:hypothetical protein AG1IA_09496 [Rhizoctonia solani AG-1 IA]
MSYVSPFLNPGQYITNLNNLSSESIAIDEGVARAVREAREFSNKYSSNFSHAAQLKDTLEQFEPYVRITGFDSVFLNLINDVGSQQDAQDVIAEFQSFSSVSEFFFVSPSGPIPHSLLNRRSAPLASTSWVVPLDQRRHLKKLNP